MAPWRLTGRVVDGLGKGAGFTALAWARRQFIEVAGVDPYPGTLNLRIETDVDKARWALVRAGGADTIVPPAGEGCEARCLPARIGGRLPCAIVVPAVEHYPPDQAEIIAAVPLRQTLGLSAGDEVEITGPDDARVRAVVFDVDGTLVNSVEGIHVAAARAAATFGLDVPFAAVRRALNTGESLWSLILPEERRGDAELHGILRRETLRHWPDVLSESVRVFPGLEDTLRLLRAAGLRLAIVTGSRGESFLPLRRAGLMEFFDPVVTAHDVERPKPDPEGMLRCLEQLGCVPAEAVYVGDSAHDVAAARAAGMRVIGVLTGAADSASLAAAGADRVIAGHQYLGAIVLASLS